MHVYSGRYHQYIYLLGDIRVSYRVGDIPVSYRVGDIPVSYPVECGS